MRRKRRRFATRSLLRHLPDNRVLAAEIIGVTRETVVRWDHPTRTITESAADNYAVRLGLHPANIWPEWFN